jgi:hypothetical protein
MIRFAVEIFSAPPRENSAVTDPLGGKIGSVTFRRKAGKWYVAVGWDRGCGT